MAARVATDFFYEGAKALKLDGMAAAGETVYEYVFFPRSVHFNIVMRDRININTDGITTGELHLLVLMKTKSFIGYKLQIKLLMHNLWCQLYK